VRAIAIVAAYNEERFVGGCIEQLHRHGVETYLLDNDSTDRTVEIAREHLGQGLIGLEHVPRDGTYAWRGLLARKAALAAELEADWFLHVDADEIRLPPRPGETLAEALERAGDEGYNAVRFQELTFVPTQEHPDHDHERFRETMRWYYPFSSGRLDQVKAWQRQPEPVDLVSSGGHVVDFPGLRLGPEPFPMLHYLFLSVPHAIEKYVERVYDADEVASGWHVLRAALRAEDIRLLPESRLRTYEGDGRLDASDPWSAHPLFARG
jgi:glycosyltransferase involved in cell wall biosynthesis